MEENFATDDLFSRRHFSSQGQNLQIGDGSASVEEQNTNNINIVSQDETKAGEETQSSTGNDEDRPKRLSKGAMKRYKVLISQGIPEEEARQQALIVPPQLISQKVNKFQPPKRLQTNGNNFRVRGGGNAGPQRPYNNKGYADRPIRSLMDSFPNFPAQQQQPGPANNRIPYGSNQIVFRRNFVEMCDGRNMKQIRVAILPLNYPIDLLSTEKMKLIEEQIVKKIILQKHSNVKPGFLTSVHKIGYMMFICRDHQTVNWLGNLYNWRNEGLQVVDTSSCELTNVMEASFPLSSELSTTTVLDMIESQNNGIFTSNWKVCSEVVPGSALHLIIAMDHASLDIVEREKFKLFYRFTCVKFDHCLGLERDIVASHERFAAGNNQTTTMGREAYGANAAENSRENVFSSDMFYNRY